MKRRDWGERGMFVSIRRTGWVILRVGRRVSTHAIMKRQSALLLSVFFLEIES